MGLHLVLAGERIDTCSVVFRRIQNGTCNVPSAGLASPLNASRSEPDPSVPGRPGMHCDWLRDAAWSWLITAATWIAAGAFSAVLEWISVRVGQQMRRDWRSIVKEHLLPRLLYWSGSRGARKQLLALVAAGTFATAGPLTMRCIPKKSSFRGLAPTNSTHPTPRKKRPGAIVVYFSYWRPPEAQGR